jgi:hypothetical protein
MDRTVGGGIFEEGYCMSDYSDTKSTRSQDTICSSRYSQYSKTIGYDSKQQQRRSCIREVRY